MAIENMKLAIMSLSDNSTPEKVEHTALRLEEMNFSPSLLFPVKGLIRMSLSQMIGHFEEIAGLEEADLRDRGIPNGKDPQEFREKHLSLFLYWSELITRLRRDDPAAWDEIYDLYEDD